MKSALKIDTLNSEIERVKNLIDSFYVELKALQYAKEREIQLYSGKVYDKYVGKLCLFWDFMGSFECKEFPVRSLIRPFHHAENNSGDPSDYRFFAGDAVNGTTAIEHGWKHFRPITDDDIKGRIYHD
jgi:hypothetical protein